MKKKSKYQKQFWWSIGIFGGICVVIFGLPTIFTQLPSIVDFTETGEIGDTIGGIMGPFVAIGAAFLTFMAFWVQKEANEAQRQDIKVERFNNNFFNLLNIHEQITNSLEYNTYEMLNGQTEPKSYRGRVIFQQAYNGIQEYDREKGRSYYGMKDRIRKEGMEAYTKSKIPTYFDHYFRNMYRIVKYVDEADVFDDDKISSNVLKEKYEYVAILRSTLSRYELVWLFYNTLSDYGRAKFKPLVEKYALLNNIRVELLVNPQDVYQFDASAFGGSYPIV